MAQRLLANRRSWKPQRSQQQIQQPQRKFQGSTRDIQRL